VSLGNLKVMYDITLFWLVMKISLVMEMTVGFLRMVMIRERSLDKSSAILV